MNETKRHPAKLYAVIHDIIPYGAENTVILSDECKSLTINNTGTWDILIKGAFVLQPGQSIEFTTSQGAYMVTRFEIQYMQRGQGQSTDLKTFTLIKENYV